MGSFDEELKNILRENKTDILDLWKKQLFTHSKQIMELMGLDNMKKRTSEILDHLIEVLPSGDDVEAEIYEPIRVILQEISREMTLKNLTPSETVMFVFSIKKAMYSILQKTIEAGKFAQIILSINAIIDKLGLITYDEYLRSTESIITEQQKLYLEVSIPLVKVWNKIIFIPLIGTLDSARIQMMTEALLDALEKKETKVAIVDISGIPAVDSRVAAYLIKVTSAAKLMGGTCIITGISPEISQAMVQSGSDLTEMTTRARLEDGLKLAFELTHQQPV